MASPLSGHAAHSGVHFEGEWTLVWSKECRESGVE